MLIPIPSSQEFLAGGCGGIAQVLAGHPFDTIKTRMQILRFTGPYDCLKSTIKLEGPLALFKGMGSPIVGVAFVNAVLFSAYGVGKSLQSGSSAKLSLYQIAGAGGFAGAVNAFVASPIELIKIRMQIQRSKGGRYTGPIDVVTSLVQQDGIRKGLFRGLFCTIIKEIPAYAGFYSGFEFLKRWQSDNGKRDLTVPELMVAGSFGGLSYWTCCYPLDVIKSRIQGDSSLSTGIIKNASLIIRTQGYSSLMRGFSVALLRSIPSAAATFTVVELYLRHM